MPNVRLHRYVLAGLSCLLIVMASGCRKQNQYEEPPPPKVTVARPLQQTVPNYLEETGTTEAVQLVAVRARVTGYLEKIHFEAGDEVAEGDILYTIEQREFKAKVASAEAALEARKAELVRAQAEYDREQQLQREDATSEREVVTAKADRDMAIAAVDSAAATLDLAQRDLEYTEVRAPISGRVEKTLVKQGNLVDGKEATHLTTIIQYDPIYANFNISERTFLRILTERRGGVSEKIDREQVRLYLQRANDKGFPFEGDFNYADLAVDQSTGTYLVRGIFDNPDFLIVPGLFVRVRLLLGARQNALLVPERAVGSDQRGRYVLIVDDKGEVQRRNVTLGPRQEDMVVVEEEEDGLAASDWVIIEGLQRARHGSKVSPKETALSAAKTNGETPRAEAASSGNAETDSLSREDEAEGNAPDAPDRSTLEDDPTGS